MLEGPEEIVVVGRPGPQRDELVLAARRRNGAVVVVVEPGREDIPLLVGSGEVDGRAAAYVCRGSVCERPVTDVAGLACGVRPGTSHVGLVEEPMEKQPRRCQDG